MGHPMWRQLSKVTQVVTSATRKERRELAERDCISSATAYCTSAYWISENNSDSFDIKVKVTRSLFVVVNHHEETRQNENNAKRETACSPGITCEL